MEPTANNASTKIIAALIIGLLVGFAAGVFWQDRRTGAEAVSTTVERNDTISEEATASAMAATSNSNEDTKATTTVPAVMGNVSSFGKLTVLDQPAGGSVFASVKDVTSPVWIAVRDYTDSKVGNILGAKKVFTDARDVSVELLRSTVAGKTYVIVVYTDRGAPSFNYKEDILQDGGATFVAK